MSTRDDQPKLLQVCNRASILGGTTACAWSCKQALPDWQHAVYFIHGEPDAETASLFNCDLHIHRERLAEVIATFNPDVILFHSTPEQHMPAIPDGVVSIYYQHATQLSSIGAREKCDIWWAVSQWLADRAGIADELVVYQPVTRPPGGSYFADGEEDPEQRDQLIIGCIATPCTDKWRPDQMALFYSRMAELGWGDYLWEFVGCPERFQGIIKDAINGKGKACFLESAWGSRRYLHEWDVMLYWNPDFPESYGRTVCEAQRAGCIPIVHRSGGFIEQIAHGKTGFLCETVEDVCRALEACGRNWESLSEYCRASGDARGSLQRWRQTFLHYVKACATN